jgi:hypothetical protein
VELAVVLPVFFLFMLVGIEFYRLNVLRHAADQAAYEAARHVIVPGATADEAQQRARDVLAQAGIRAADVTVMPGTISELTPSVTVQVDVPVARNAWYLTALTRTRILQGEATLRTERSPAIASKGLLPPVSSAKSTASAKKAGSGISGTSTPPTSKSPGKPSGKRSSPKPTSQPKPPAPSI